MKRILVYFLGILFCLFISYLSYRTILNRSSIPVDLIVYQGHLKALSEFSLDNPTREISNIFYDHQEFNLILLVPFYKIWANSIYIAPSLILIFFPTIILDLITKSIIGRWMLWWELVVSFIFLSLHPFTQNSIFYFYHNVYLLSFLIPLVFLLTIRNSKWTAFLVLFTLTTKEDTIIWLPLFLLQFLFLYSYLFQCSIFGGLKRLLTTKSIFFSILTSALYLVLLVRFRENQLVDYSFDFNFPETHRLLQLTNYMSADILSFPLGNVVGLLHYVARLSNEHTSNPYYHHGSIMPMMTLLTIWLWYISREKDLSKIKIKQ